MAGRRRRAVLVGTGALATATADSLATEGRDVDVLVVGRTAVAAETVCGPASARASAAESGVRFSAHVDPLSSERPSLWRGRPDLVVVLASSQSPWEAQRRPSAWTDLVRAGGFGVTLPFQFDLAHRVARVAAEDGVPVLNGCLPDLVNPLLAAQEVPVLAGIGNGATIHAFLRAAVQHSSIRVVAHHRHLHAPGPGESDVWVRTDDGQSVDSAGLLASMRAAPRDQLNRVTGLVTAHVVRALLDPEVSLRTTLPGVHGRQGGIPVRISDGRIEADLGSWTDSAVRAANAAWSLADGATVDEEGTVTLSIRAADALSAHLDGLPATYQVSDVPALTTRISQLRDTLRTQPSGEAS